MTPQEVNDSARDLYNAVGDTFFTDAQIWKWIWQGERILARKAFCIEVTSTGSTVASTQSYAYPTGAIAVKRVAVNGRKLSPISFRQDDAITLSNQAVTSSGSPIYYTDWNSLIYMRPIPDSVYTINWYTYNDPTQVTSGSSTLDVPSLFQFDLVDYVLYQMFAKDKDIANMEFHRDEWLGHVADAKAFMKRKKRGDSFATVQSEEILPVNIMGAT